MVGIEKRKAPLRRTRSSSRLFNSEVEIGVRVCIEMWLSFQMWHCPQNPLVVSMSDDSVACVDWPQRDRVASDPFALVQQETQLRVGLFWIARDCWDGWDAAPSSSITDCLFADVYANVKVNTASVCVTKGALTSMAHSSGRSKSRLLHLRWLCPALV